MCGLIAVIKRNYKKHTGSKVINYYESQKKRGSEGFGYIAIKDNKIVRVVRSKNDKDIKKFLNDEKADHILFHHRKPTSTENTLGTTHPILVSHPELEFDYYFAHNGIIRNTSYLKKEHEKLGYHYNTEHSEKTYVEYTNGTKEIVESSALVHNDSESLAIELARYIEGKSKTINAIGAMAFWGVSFDKATKEVGEIFFGKNYGREFGIDDTNKFCSLVSESGASIKEMKLFSFKLDDKFNFQEIPLPVNEDKKEVQVYNYNTRVANTDDLPMFSNEVDKEVYEIMPNYYYTQQQRVLTGLPARCWCTENVQTEKQLLKKHIGVGIVQRVQIHTDLFNTLLNQIQGIRDKYTQKLPEPEYTPSDSDWEREKVEEWAISYAEKMATIDAIDTDYSHGRISEHTRDTRVGTLEKECSDLETNMYTSGLPYTEVEDIIETALQIADYNDSFKRDQDSEEEENNQQIVIGFNRNVIT